jgi:hypothetical protein
MNMHEQTHHINDTITKHTNIADGMQVPENVNSTENDEMILEVQCMQTVFKTNGEVEQTGPQKARIISGVEFGFFSIQNIDNGMMFTVTLEDAMYAISEALKKAKKMEKAT